MFIVIEGVDGAGKATQTKLLKEYLSQKGSVETLSFPSYGQRSAVFVEKFLKGELGNMDDSDPYISSMFYILDRIGQLNTLQSLFKSSEYVISDRYSISNFIHRGSKFLEQGNKNEMKKFFDRLYEMEFTRGKLPMPDKIFFLSLSIEGIQTLLLKKAQEKRDYLEAGGLDEAEKNIKHQTFSLEVGENHLKEYFPQIEIIECENTPGVVLPPEEIHRKIVERINL